MACRMLGKLTSQWLERLAPVPVSASPISIYSKVKLYSVDSIQDLIYYGTDTGSAYWVLYANSTDGSSVTAGAFNHASGVGGADASAVPSGRAVAGDWVDAMMVVFSTTNRWCYLNINGVVTTAQNTTSRNVTGTFEFDVFAFRSGGSTFGAGDAGISKLGVWRSALSVGEFVNLCQGAPLHSVRGKDLRAAYAQDGDSFQPSTFLLDTNKMFSRTGKTPFDLEVTGNLLGEVQPLTGTDYDWFAKRQRFMVKTPVAPGGVFTKITGNPFKLAGSGGGLAG